MSLLYAQSFNVNWYLLPLIVAFSLVYGGTRYESWPFILVHAFHWSLYIVSFLAATQLVLLLISWDISVYWYLPIIIAVVVAFHYVGRPKPEPAAPDAAKK